MNYRNVFFLFFVLSISITFSQDKRGHNPTVYMAEYLRYDNTYHAAERFSSNPDYSEEKINAMNQEALDGFIKIVPVIEKAGDDSIAFHCWSKIGILQHYFDSLVQAQQSYQKAIKLKLRLPQLADSFYSSLIFSTAAFITARTCLTLHYPIIKKRNRLQVFTI